MAEEVARRRSVAQGRRDSISATDQIEVGKLASRRISTHRRDSGHATQQARRASALMSTAVRRVSSLASVKGAANRRSSTQVKLLEVAVLHQGDCFGEVALQNNQPRSATIQTKDECNFATLTRDDFQAILHDTFDKQQQDRENFLRALPLLAALSDKNVHKLSALIQLKLFTRNEPVFNFGAPVIQAYFVKDGSFDVECKLLPTQKLEEADATNGPRGASLGKRASMSGSQAMTMRRPNHGKEQLITTAVLLAPSMFGITDYLRGERRHRNRVVCKSVTGSIYCLLAKELLHYLSKDQRHHLQAISQVQDMFYKNRCLVLHRLSISEPRPRSQDLLYLHGARRWPGEEDINYRNTRLRQADGNMYRTDGRLQKIGQAFAHHHAHDARHDAPHDFHHAHSDLHGDHHHHHHHDAGHESDHHHAVELSDAHHKLGLKPCWRMEEIALHGKPRHPLQPAVPAAAVAIAGNSHGGSEDARDLLVTTGFSSLLPDLTDVTARLPQAFKKEVIHWEGHGHLRDDPSFFARRSPAESGMPPKASLSPGSALRPSTTPPIHQMSSRSCSDHESPASTRLRTAPTRSLDNQHDSMFFVAGCSTRTRGNLEVAAETCKQPSVIEVACAGKEVSKVFSEAQRAFPQAGVDNSGVGKSSQRQGPLPELLHKGCAGKSRCMRKSQLSSRGRLAASEADGPPQHPQQLLSHWSLTSSTQVPVCDKFFGFFSEDMVIAAETHASQEKPQLFSSTENIMRAIGSGAGADDVSRLDTTVVDLSSLYRLPPAAGKVNAACTTLGDKSCSRSCFLPSDPPARLSSHDAAHRSVRA
mmetsp:Transcript_134618/g.348776  ORF Transcript_134618/g.348776 Transcript_134618/m.348776 type:complete len:817 (+) Transcript_134618:555-3005(+)